MIEIGGKVYLKGNVIPNRFIVRFSPDRGGENRVSIAKVQKWIDDTKITGLNRLIDNETIDKIVEIQLDEAITNEEWIYSHADEMKRLYVIEIGETNLEMTSRIIDTLVNRSEIESIDVEIQGEFSYVPNDPNYYECPETPYSFYIKIQASQAWDYTFGSNSVSVAVIDTGVDYTHPDLDGNMLPGYDFYFTDDDPMDDYMHGTVIAGIIAAEIDNSIGACGIAPNVKILPVKAGSTGVNTTDLIESIAYAIASGSKILNISATFPVASTYLYDAIEAAKNANALVVTCSGNSGWNIDNSMFHQYPACFDLPNIITVAATYPNDGIADFSNYGDESVDLAAPGMMIFSTTPHVQTWVMTNNNIPAMYYDMNQGTSYAAPFVAGAAAMLKALHPDWNYEQIKNNLLSTVDTNANLAGKVLSGGRLNVFKAVTTCNWEYNIPDKAWGGYEGWTFSGCPCAYSGIGSGCLQYYSYAGHTYIDNTPSSGVFADASKYLSIRLKAQAGTQLALTANGQTTNYAITADNQFHEYRFDLNFHPGWTGTVSNVRLDPSNLGGQIYIDYIRFTH